MPVRRVVAGAVAGLFLCGSVSCGGKFEREVSGVVLEIDGNAESVGKISTIALTENEPLRPGTKIILPRDSRVDLMLLPGILVELTGPAELEILALHLARNGDENIRPMILREARVKLRAGKLTATVGRSQTRSRLLVETTAGTLAAGAGRTFLVEATGERTRLMTVQGRLSFQPTGGSARQPLEPGQIGEWPGALAPFSAASAGAEAQSQVVQIMATKRRLQEAGKEFAARSAPWPRGGVIPATFRAD